MPRERLQKLIASSGLASRRGGEAMIRAGRVVVDGRPAILGESVDPELQRVIVDGKPLPVQREPRSYWLLNKPAGVVSTVQDPHAEKTVIDLMPVDARIARIYPVGRLDEDSEGLLLLTDDGDWAQLLLHPRYGVEREYAVGLARALNRGQKETLLAGIQLEEGTARVDHIDEMTPAQVRKLADLLAPPHPELRWYRVTLAQGWKRQIRRMFEVVGQPVRRLVRVRVGTLKMTDLRAGQSRRLTSDEVRGLAASARLTHSSRIRRPHTGRPRALVAARGASDESDGPLSSGG